MSTTLKDFSLSEGIDYSDSPIGIQELIKNFDVQLSTDDISYDGLLIPKSNQSFPESIDIGIGELKLPLTNGGIPFTLVALKDGTTSIKGWQFEIFLSEIILIVEGLQPAIYVEEQGTVPRHLLRDPNKKEVSIIGQSAWLRISKPVDGSGVSFIFVEQSQKEADLKGSHAFSSIYFSPSSFFIGSSDFGFTVANVVFDFSDQLSPSFINDMTIDPSWVGLAIEEATFYAPRNQPIVGDLSAGVRHLLLGKPLGVQGELEVQFGRSPLNPTTFKFNQIDPVTSDPTSLNIRGNDRSYFVDITGHQDQDVDIEVSLAAAAPANSTLEWTALWNWDGSSSNEGLTSSGTVKHANRLKVEPIEIIKNGNDKKRIFHPPIYFEFVTSGSPPEARAKLDQQIFEQLVHVSGTKDSFSQIEFTAVSNSNLPGQKSYEWELIDKGVTLTGSSVTFDLTSVDLLGSYTVKLTETLEDGNQVVKLVSHIQLEILLEGDTLFGTANGVFHQSDQTSPLQLSSVDATFSLTSFLSRGILIHKTSQTLLNVSNLTEVILPSDGLAQVVIAQPVTTATTSNSPTITDIDHDRHIQILFEYANDNALSWGNQKPSQSLKSSFANEVDLQIQLLRWANKYPGATYLIIGRCDDIGRNKPNIDDNNIELAKDRAKKGRQLLTSLLTGSTGDTINNDDICIRGETSKWETTECKNLESQLIGTFLTDEESVSAVDNAQQQQGWLMRFKYKGEYESWVNSLDPSKAYEQLRKQYRRIDIYAVGGTPNNDTIRKPGIEIEVNRRKSFISGIDDRSTPNVSGASSSDYRVKLLARWDSPYVNSMKDAIPVLAEAEFAWTPDKIPDIEGEPLGIVKPPQETLTTYAKWIHNAETGFTETTLGIKSEGDDEGLVASENKTLVSALSFGPALLSVIDLENDVYNAGARMAALIAVAAVGNNYLVKKGKIALMKVETKAHTSSISNPLSDYQVSLLIDYNATVHADSEVMGIKTVNNRPLKIRYKDVGVEFDNNETAWRKVGLVYDKDSSMEIVDSGQWKIDGKLGKLLRIAGIEFGTGSLWVEVEIAIALDIGIIEISKAIIRLTYEGQGAPKFQLRGFEIKVEIPGIITKGSGNLKIEDKGSQGVLIRAGIGAFIIPLGLAVNATFAMQKVTSPKEFMFLHLYLSVQFATPLTIPPIPIAIYGFIGSFTMNGSRNIDNNPDPVARELDWWVKKHPSEKYKPDHGQYAIGLGIIIGTLPDTSFSFSASGMLVVAFPNPEVILGVDVSLLSLPNFKVSDQADSTGSLTGLVVINKDAITVAVLGSYSIPKFLELKVPFGAYFANPNNANASNFVRLGSDGVTNIAKPRYGEKITLTLLPGTLDVKAWAFLMIEESGIQSLGGNPNYSLDGFSIGFGAGWEIRWGSGRIKFEAYAKVLVGFGTKPLLIKGGIYLNGELVLGPVSISTTGDMELTYQNNDVYLKAKVCGEVDTFFFSIKGCLGVDFGTESNDSTPTAPEPPLVSVSLVDRKNIIMGTAVDVPSNGIVTLKSNPLFKIDANGNNVGSKPIDNNTVWADTAPILQFSHYIANAQSSNAQFEHKATPTQPKWFGSTKLKYTYQLDSLTLRDITDPNNIVLVDNVIEGINHNLLSTWMTSPYRQPNSSGLNNPIPSEHEGPNLKLLDWNPMAWVQGMENGGKNTQGDPVQTIKQICETKTTPAPFCLYGEHASSIDNFTVKIDRSYATNIPYYSKITAVISPDFGSTSIANQLNLETHTPGRDLAETVASSPSITSESGLIIDLPNAVQIHHESIKKAYQLPVLKTILLANSEYKYINLPLSWEIKFDKNITDPVITLMVCYQPNYLKAPTKWCERFEGHKPHAILRRNELSLPERFNEENPGFTISSINSRFHFTLGDFLNKHSTPFLDDQELRADLMFPHTGIRLTFERLCKQIEVRIYTFNKSVIKVMAFDENNSVVITKSISSRRKQALKVHLNAKDAIKYVTITGGSGEAVLYQVCYTFKPEFSKAEITANLKNLPIIKGVSNHQVSEEWQYTLKNEFHSNSNCYLVEYRPKSQSMSSPWSKLLLNSNTINSMVSIVAICGVDEQALKKYHEDKKKLDELEKSIHNPVEDKLKVLLKPGHVYEIELGWSWKSWQSSSDTDTTPPDTSEGSWSSGNAQKFRFAIAHESITSGESQTGLNEHVFDPRDIERYLKTVQPTNGQIAHLTSSPLWIHFETDHVNQLLAQYDRELKIEVRRTDPPPKSQSTVSISVPVASPLTPITLTDYKSPNDLNSSGYRRVNNAIIEARCLPNIPIVGGKSIEAVFDLEPSAMYDFNLLAVNKNGTDPLVIHASRFKTSAYADPEQLIRHLGYGMMGSFNPYLPSDIILSDNASLPGGSMEVSDNLIDELIAIFGIGAIPLPTQTPKTYAIWRKITPSSGSWLLEGVFVDSIEPLKRSGAVATGNQAELTDLVRLERAVINNIPLNIHRANMNWTRVFLKPSQPIQITDNANNPANIELIFFTPEKELSGYKVISNQPAIIQREGF